MSELITEVSDCSNCKKLEEKNEFLLRKLVNFVCICGKKPRSGDDFCIKCERRICVHGESLRDTTQSAIERFLCSEKCLQQHESDHKEYLKHLK